MMERTNERTNERTDPSTNKQVEEAIEDEHDQRLRIIAEGETVNILSLIGVWDMAVETVVAAQPGDSYVIQVGRYLSFFTLTQTHRHTSLPTYRPTYLPPCVPATAYFPTTYIPTYTL